MEWSDEKTYELIDLVRGYELLYNKLHPDYKFPAKKSSAWEDISKRLGCTTTAANSKWTTLRERFGKEMRDEKKGTPSGSAASMKPKWRFTECLKFLSIHIKVRKTMSNMDPPGVPLITTEQVAQIMSGSLVVEEVQDVDDPGVNCSSSLFPVGSAEERTVASPCSLPQEALTAAQELAAINDVGGSSVTQRTDSSSSSVCSLSSATPRTNTKTSSAYKRPRWVASEEHQNLKKQLGEVDSALSQLSSPVASCPEDALVQDLKEVLLSVEDDLDRMQYRIEVRSLISKIEMEELQRKRAKATLSQPSSSM